MLPKLAALWSARDTIAPAAFAVGLATLAGIIGLKRLRPKWPGLLISVVAASGGAWLLGLPIDTVGTRYGGLPGSFPAPVLPDLSWSAVQPVLPSSFTIAFLIGVGSLLSAVAADAMAGTRHRSNMEIVAQGAANIASPLFGGLPATGVIARTGTSIAAGRARRSRAFCTRSSCCSSSCCWRRWPSYLALPCLAAVLLTTAWRLLELEHMRHFLSRAPWDDRVILAATTLLTVFVDLSVAIAVGVVLASMLFMHRMAETPGVHLGTGPLVLEDQIDGSEPRSLLMTQDLPPGVRVFDFRGPLFFGASARVGTVLKALGDWPKVLILRMREVPLIDATAIEALQEIAALSSRHGCRIVIAGLQAQPREALHRYGFLRENRITLAPTGAIALEEGARFARQAEEGCRKDKGSPDRAAQHHLADGAAQALRRSRSRSRSFRSWSSWASIHRDIADCQLFCHISAACIHICSGAMAMLSPDDAPASKPGIAPSPPDSMRMGVPGDFSCCCQASIIWSMKAACMREACWNWLRVASTSSRGHPVAFAASPMRSSTLSVQRSVVEVTSSRHSDIASKAPVTALRASSLRPEVEL